MTLFPLTQTTISWPASQLENKTLSSRLNFIKVALVLIFFKRLSKCLWGPSNFSCRSRKKQYKEAAKPCWQKQQAKKISKSSRQYLRLIEDIQVQKVAIEIGISHGSIYTILTNKLNMRHIQVQTKARKFKVGVDFCLQ